MKIGEKTRLRKAEDKALERLDYVGDRYVASDFVEIVGRVGGDTVTYLTSLSMVCCLFSRRLCPVRKFTVLL